MEYIHTTNELDLESAIRLLEKYLQDGEVDLLIALADLYSKAGNPEKEIELLRSRVTEGEPNALHNLGLALWHSGHLLADVCTAPAQRVLARVRMRVTSSALAARRTSETAMIGAKLQHQRHSRSASIGSAISAS